MDTITAAIMAALENQDERVTQDIYDALKSIISQKFGAHSDLVEAIGSLEKKPDSYGRKETLAEEITNAQAQHDPDIQSIAQTLLRLQNQAGDTTTLSQHAGDQAIQIGQIGRDAHIVNASLGGIAAGRDIYLTGDQPQKRADQKIEQAREKVQAWGARVKQRQLWDEHSWHLLGQALHLAREAIKFAPNYQRPWTFLADIYHRIGKEALAKRCLAKSYSLAPPNDPGGFYQQTAANIKSGYPFNHVGKLIRPAIPLWFEKKYQRYWRLDEL